MSPPDVVPPKSEKRESLTEWLTPEVPDMVVAGCQWTIRRAGREPNAPDETWKDRWADSYEKSIGHYVPKLEMHPIVALLVATLFLWLSMFVGAKRAQKADNAKPAAKPAEKPADAQQEDPACPTPATDPSPAASPASAGDFGDQETSTSPHYCSVQVDTSGADGSVTNAKEAA